MENEENENTTISISKTTKELLDEKKIHYRETYEDVILRLMGVKNENDHIDNAR